MTHTASWPLRKTWSQNQWLSIPWKMISQIMDCREQWWLHTLRRSRLWFDHTSPEIQTAGELGKSQHVHHSITSYQTWLLTSQMKNLPQSLVWRLPNSLTWMGGWWAQHFSLLVKQKHSYGCTGNLTGGQRYFDTSCDNSQRAEQKPKLPCCVAEERKHHSEITNTNFGY